MIIFLSSNYFDDIDMGRGDEPEYNIYREQEQKKKNVIDLFFLLKGKDTDLFWHQSLTSWPAFVVFTLVSLNWKSFWTQVWGRDTFYNNFILIRTFILQDLKALGEENGFIENKVTDQNIQTCKSVQCDNTKHVFCIHPPLVLVSSGSGDCLYRFSGWLFTLLT